ncbi:hypothetical protein DL98DRAFT_97495 [Cadophora sp. DSE1049]|nr:hypothetical protein DL98DRAFT_97495 [Cadophora sp. DSE1049]
MRLKDKMPINELASKAAALVKVSSNTTSQSMASSNPQINVVPAIVEDYDGEDFEPDEIPEQLKDECLVNFFRCRYKERPELKTKYEALPQKNERDQRGRIGREIDRIEKLRNGFDETERNKPDIELFKYRQTMWRRHAIGTCRDNFVNVEARVAEWIKCNKFKSKAESDRRIELEKKILTAVSHWKPPDEPSTLPKILQDAKKAEEEAAALIKDPLTYLIEKATKRFKAKKEESKPPSLQRRETIDTSRKFELPEDSYGISVHKITLRQSDKSCPSSYMSYGTDRYPLSEILLASDTNPLTKRCEPNTIRHFHFPANNMHWIEEAIARYHGEETPGEFNYRKHGKYCEKSSNLLCRQFWTSLQHGGIYDPVHARHMRSHCSLITPDTACGAEPITGSKNFVIFMPYLHWETHRRRKKMTEIMKEVTEEYHRDRPHVTESLREEITKTAEELYLRHARQLTDFLSLEEAAKKKKEKPLKPGEKRKKRGALGEYLLQVARIYDALDIEPDVRILRDHLHKDPPLHARRTLDQSYYWKLQNTDGRDEDQVVYRETKRGKNISRTSRVIMVDQLWLYILDDSRSNISSIECNADEADTIISSFPRRWGRNKPDWSGVHKGIRARLDHLREGEIQSVYDVALLIMNQCSTVFFDRTKPVDERPEVLDIFSNALSHVSGMKCISFESFWRQLEKLSSGDHQQADFEATARKYLNINPEGELLRETHDIIEELRMMSHIFTEQLHVVEQFTSHLQNLREKEEKKQTTEMKMLDVMVEVRKLLEERLKKEDDQTDVLSSQSGTPLQTDDSTENGSAGHDHLATSQAIRDENATLTGTGTNPGPNSPAMNSTGVAEPQPTSSRGIPAAEGAADASCQTTISVAKISIPENTIQFAQDVGREMSGRRAELQKLEQSTVYVSDQLKDLLDLKQQQASIIEAKYALKRADESVSQGRSIMLFTIVTIVFLPLSFMSSVFGMNAKDFADAKGDPNMSLRHIFKLLFPISVGVIIISLALAFSTFIRSLFYFIGSVIWAFISEYSYARYVWHICVRIFNKITKRTEKPKDHKSDGFYGLKNEAVRWIYGRKERSKLKKEWTKAKLLEKERLEKLANGGVAVREGSRAGLSTGMSNGDASAHGALIEGEGLSAAGTNNSNGVSGSARDSVHGKGRRFRGNRLRGSGGNLSDKSAV